MNNILNLALIGLLIFPTGLFLSYLWDFIFKGYRPSLKNFSSTIQLDLDDFLFTSDYQISEIDRRTNLEFMEEIEALHQLYGNVSTLKLVLPSNKAANIRQKYELIQKGNPVIVKNIHSKEVFAFFRAEKNELEHQITKIWKDGSESDLKQKIKKSDWAYKLTYAFRKLPKKVMKDYPAEYVGSELIYVGRVEFTHPVIKENFELLKHLLSSKINIRLNPVEYHSGLKNLFSQKEFSNLPFSKHLEKKTELTGSELSLLLSQVASTGEIGKFRKKEFLLYGVLQSVILSFLIIAVLNQNFQLLPFIFFLELSSTFLLQTLRTEKLNIKSGLIILNLTWPILVFFLRKLSLGYSVFEPIELVDRNENLALMIGIWGISLILTIQNRKTLWIVPLIIVFFVLAFFFADFNGILNTLNYIFALLSLYSLLALSLYAREYQKKRLSEN